MKNVLILPPALFKLATETAEKRGITLIELCQLACLCPVDDVIEQKPIPFDPSKVYERTGLEA